jgi:hypothetical protein
MAYVTAPKTNGKIINVSIVPGLVLAKAAITLPTYLPDMDLREGNPILAIGITDQTPAASSYTADNYSTGLAGGTFCVTSARIIELGDATTAKTMMDITYLAAGDIKHA